MQLTFFIPASRVLGFTFVAKTVLRRHQCFDYCRAVTAQHQGCLANPLTLKKARLGAGRRLGERSDQRDMVYDAVLCDKSRDKEENGETSWL